VKWTAIGDATKIANVFYHLLAESVNTSKYMLLSYGNGIDKRKGVESFTVVAECT